VFLSRVDLKLIGVLPLVACFLFLSSTVPAQAPTHYAPTIESLNRHPVARQNLSRDQNGALLGEQT